MTRTSRLRSCFPALRCAARRRSYAPLLLALSILAAACGGSDDRPHPMIPDPT
ncbi:MAG: hypothetical protein OEO23_08465 [Gemmatimonadota bacterium]|nr:hypothetical protein [Gemmatimonadota bacterium]